MHENILHIQEQSQHLRRIEKNQQRKTQNSNNQNGKQGKKLICNREKRNDMLHLEEKRNEKNCS
jgi:hypothetical protein